MAEFFTYLIESDINTIAFCVGSILLAVSIIGKIDRVIDLKPVVRIFLGIFGLLLLFIGLFSYFFSEKTVVSGREVITNDNINTNVDSTSTTSNTEILITATPFPTVTDLPTFVTPSTPWVQQLSRIPESGTQISYNLTKDQLMIVTGGQWKFNNTYCGGSAVQICVFLFKSTKVQTVTLDSVITYNNYLGVTGIYSFDEVISLHEPNFWIPPNCIDGCQKASVYLYEDGVLKEKRELSAQ